MIEREPAQPPKKAGQFMEHEDLLDALSGQLTALQEIAKWALGFGFAATILAIQGDDPISILNLQLTRTQAFFVISSLYVAACVAAVGRFRRITDLLADLAPEKVKLGYSKLEAHPWLFNPFVLSDFKVWKIPLGAISLFCLVCLFWLCLSSLYALLPDVALQIPLQIVIANSWRDLNTWMQFGLVFVYLAPIGLFVIVGDLAVSSIQDVINESTKRIPDPQVELRDRLLQHRSALKAAASHGIGTGGLILTVVIVWSKGPW